MLIVAEIGSMHKGKPALAYELIKQAKYAGADIAKFQFGWTREAQEQQHHVPYLELRYIDPYGYSLAEWCDYFDIELMASIWSVDGLQLARQLDMQKFKVAHQLVEKPECKYLIDEILSFGKTTFVSGVHYGHVEPFLKDNVVPIVTTGNYPTYPNEVVMPKTFSQFRGYSDHTPGIEMCLLAASRGADYIEKHFCLDKTDLCVKDTAFSATPDEFRQMAQLARELRKVSDA